MSEVTITITPEMRAKLMNEETLTIELPGDGWKLASYSLPPAKLRVIGYDPYLQEQVFAYREDSGTWMVWQQTTLDEGWTEHKDITHWRYMAEDPITEGGAA